MKSLAIVSLLSLSFLACLPQDASAQTRIRFARGRTSASVNSTIYRNAQRKYVLAARAGQFLSATVSSQNGCVVLGNQATSTSYETDSGDNIIDLFNNCRTTTRFTLTVSIR